ncbi:hypothetical protein DQK91_00575 [Oceanidesulfovibrio marinus]|uniref:Uncharacterized protein n=2 Tax=Oceanidesulfovibrio marinus TaxID=370038 RepID=A0A6P1ZKZ0_9BACT|nr:hypothetical protein DQK91_00575 [Oceanidesulfovibrio marinus]
MYDKGFKMGVFKEEKEFKRVIFNVEVSIAERLEQAKERSRTLGRKLDVDTAVDKALEKFLKKAEKKLEEVEEEQEKKQGKKLKLAEDCTAEQEPDAGSDTDGPAQ